MYRRLLIPCLSTLAMMLVLLELGTWQVSRLHWKQQILAQIEAAEAGPAAPLTGDPAAYAKVAVSGRFRFDQAAAFGAEVRDMRSGSALGSFQIVPLIREGAPAVLVDRGWVPRKPDVPLDNPTGVVTVTGYVRPADTPGWFSAPDDAATRTFFTLDPHAIGIAVGVPNPLPFILVAIGPSAAESYPVPARHLPLPPNNHLFYAITWYGLAAALAVIFGVWIRKALRS